MSDPTEGPTPPGEERAESGPEAHGDTTQEAEEGAPAAGGPGGADPGEPESGNPEPGEPEPGDSEPAGPDPAGARPRGGLATWLAARGTRWGSATAVYVAVVVGVLVAVNLVGSRITGSWDVTSQHLLTLSAASRRIARSVTRPVQIIAFTQPGDPTASQILILLRQYARDSKGRITYQTVDPVTHSALAARYSVQAYDTVVVQSGSNIQTVSPSSLTTYNSAGNAVFNGESAITNAILRAGAPVSLKVDWLAGDGEPDITAGRHPDATQALKNVGYQVGSLNLLTSNGVPSNVAAIVIDSPTRDLSAAEIAALSTYAKGGGHLIVLLPPQLKPLPRLDALLASWGITPQNDVAIDMAQHYQSDPTQIVPRYVGSAITNPIEQANMATLLPGAQGLTLSHPKGYTVTPVLQTSSGGSATAPESWGMTNLSASTISYTAHKDIPGPLALAASAESSSASSSSAASSTSSTSSSSSSSASSTAAKPSTLPSSGAPGFRAVVFGNSLFISSGSLTGGQGAYIGIQGNEDLFLNAVGWVTGQSQGITVRPNPSLSTQVFLTAGTTRTLVLVFVAGIPLLCFALAFGTWFSRRRL